MSLRRRALVTAARGLARRGFEVRRHAAKRRQSILARQGVDLVIDVGAAGGGYGRSLREFGYSGRIASFEPLSAAYGRLEASAAADPRWEIRRLALGAEPGAATIHVASNSDSSSLLPMLDAHREAAPWVDYVGEEEIEIARLDDLAPSLLADAAAPFLKIDTQGFERDVLAGAAATVPRLAGLQLELSFVPLYEGGMLVDEAIGWAYDHGFHMVSVEQGYAAPSGEILQVDAVFVRDAANAAEE